MSPRQERGLHFSVCCPEERRSLWVATHLMSLTCDICRADWEWLEASVCLQHSSNVCGAERAQSGLCQHCLLLLIAGVFISVHEGVLGGGLWRGCGLVEWLGRDTGSPGPLRMNQRRWVKVTLLLQRQHCFSRRVKVAQRRIHSCHDAAYTPHILLSKTRQLTAVFTLAKYNLGPMFFKEYW